MTQPPTPELEGYLARLEARLGDAREAHEFIDELRDHVLTAMDTYIGLGDTANVAVERAIETLGPQDDLVRELRAEIRRKRIAIGAFALLVGASALGFLWLVILATGPRLPWTEHREPLVLEWSDSIGVASMRLAICAAVVANALFWISVKAGRHSSIGRFEGCSMTLCRISGTALAIAVGSILIYVGIRFSLAPRSLEVSDITLGALLTLTTTPFALLPTLRSGNPRARSRRLGFD